MRRLMAVVASIFVAAVVGASLTLMQSPGSARLRKADTVRAQDVEAIRNAVRLYVETHAQLPEALEAVTEGSGLSAARLRDPLTGAAYGYRRVDDTHFEVCATFALDARDEAAAYPRRSEVRAEEDAFWNHRRGEQCFRFTSTWPK